MANNGNMAGTQISFKTFPKKLFSTTILFFITIIIYMQSRAIYHNLTLSLQKTNQIIYQQLASKIYTSLPLIDTKNISFPLCNNKNKCAQWEIYNYKHKTDYLYKSLPNYYKPNQSIILLYVHGQNELKSNKYYNQKLETWGKLLNKEHHLLIAPNLYGNNWGSDQALQELINLTKQLKKKYPYTRIYLLAYSMGGLLGYKIIANKDLLNLYDKIIIFAGTLPLSILDQNTCLTIVQNKSKLKIYHGTKDINVPISQSTNILLNYCKRFDTDISPILVFIPGYDHWDLGYTTNVQLLLGRK